MKKMTHKQKIVLGLALFLIGTLLMQMPFFINLDQHFMLRHALIVLGSINVFVGFVVALPSRR